MSLVVSACTHPLSNVLFPALENFRRQVFLGMLVLAQEWLPGPDSCLCHSMLRLQKRLASSVLRCGKKKVWLDPNETNEIANANSREFLGSVPLLHPFLIFHVGDGDTTVLTLNSSRKAALWGLIKRSRLKTVEMPEVLFLLFFQNNRMEVHGGTQCCISELLARVFCFIAV